MKKIIINSLLALILLVALLVSSCSTAPPTPTAEPGSLEWRLDRLVEELEQQRQTLHIPGMAIAIVKDDEVILAEGFGVTDIETEAPVTPETIFAIGSTTKAFTSTLVGMLVDEGMMDWDDPITEYLPYFQPDIESENETAEIVIRDLLSHRTGFTRMPLLHISGEVPREEVLHDANNAEAYSGFREKFYYSNVMYMAAGVAAGKAANTDWDTLVAERIFEPLGMESTSASVEQAQKDPRLSLGFMWDDTLQDYKYKPMRTVDNIGPSGAINSNVIDMTQWLRLQLGRGEYEGQRLISEETLRETWTAHIDIAGGVSYGLGWMLREWEGQPVVEHGGNVAGFAAQVALLPESDLGFVLLTNVRVTPLQQLSINMVWEALLGEWEDTDTTEQTGTYEPYLGKYMNKFGPLKDREYTVLIQNGRLALDAAGEAVYELKEPDEEGKWYFVVTDQVAISFDRDDEGNVIAIEIHQGGLTFEMPMVGLEIAPDIDLNELQRYLGSYHSDNLSITTEVLIQNNRLAIDVPGEMAYEMYPPDEQGIWVFRVSNRLTLKFNETQDGQIDSLTYYQAGQAYDMNRVEGRTLPTVEEILALRDTDSRNEALQEMGTYKISGTIHSLQSGVKGNVTIYVGDNERYRVDSDYGKYGYSREAVNDNRSWSESSFASFEEYYGKFLEQDKRDHPAAIFGDWRDFNDSISMLGTRILDGNEVYVLKLEHKDLPPITIYIDTTTGDVLKAVIVALLEGGSAIPIVVSFEDYREVNGVRIPFRTISSNEQSGRDIVQYESIEVNLDIDEGFFTLSMPDQAH